MKEQAQPRGFIISLLRHLRQPQKGALPKKWPSENRPVGWLIGALLRPHTNG